MFLPPVQNIGTCSAPVAEHCGAIYSEIQWPRLILVGSDESMSGYDEPGDVALCREHYLRRDTADS